MSDEHNAKLNSQSCSADPTKAVSDAPIRDFDEPIF